MAINKKLIHFQTLNNFEQLLSAGNILDTSICFIKDAKKIWTHGCFYDCVETNTYVKYVAQFLSDELKELVRLNIGAVASDEVLIYLSDYYTKTEINNKGYITDISNKQDKITDLDAIRSGASAGATAVQHSELSSVAISGDYNALINKPSTVTESTVSGWGFTKNTGTYSKPSTGIPKSDLATAIQTSLGKADTALQSYTEQYKGTVTGVKVNGTTKNPSNGVVDLGTVITSHQDISGKQDKLVSGTNIKTINGTSILGSGDIIISGGGSSGGNGAYAKVNHETSDTAFTLTPNTFHVWDDVSLLSLTLGSETSGIANEYIFQFKSGSEPTTLILPDSIKFNSVFTVEANKIYQISILNGLGTVMSWDI